MASNKGGQLSMNVTKYPRILTCYGAFITLGQAISFMDSDEHEPLFLPNVCIFSYYADRVPGVSVLVDVFIHYADSHPEDGGKDFIIVAWNAFKAAWPCKN